MSSVGAFAEILKDTKSDVLLILDAARAVTKPLPGQSRQPMKVALPEFMSSLLIAFLELLDPPRDRLIVCHAIRAFG
jgi:hypothetical protein